MSRACDGLHAALRVTRWYHCFLHGMDIYVVGSYYGLTVCKLLFGEFHHHEQAGQVFSTIVT